MSTQVGKRSESLEPVYNEKPASNVLAGDTHRKFSRRRDRNRFRLTRLIYRKFIHFVLLLNNKK